MVTIRGIDKVKFIKTENNKLFTLLLGAVKELSGQYVYSLRLLFFLYFPSGILVLLSEWTHRHFGKRSDDSKVDTKGGAVQQENSPDCEITHL